MSQPSPQLMIVYNADGGILNAIKDTAHKIISPGTYPCSLCALTHGAVSMRGAWRKFLSGQHGTVTFHHREDFARDFPEVSMRLSAILIRSVAGSIETLVSSEELNAMASLDELIALTGQRIRDLQQTT